MKVEEIMNKVFVVDSDITLKKAAQIMSKKSIGCLAILNKRKIAGIITERDIIKNTSSLNKKVSSVMSRNVISIAPKGTLEEAACLMAYNKIKRLLVTENNKLVGIITATDILINSDLLNEDLFF